MHIIGLAPKHFSICEILCGSKVLFLQRCCKLCSDALPVNSCFCQVRSAYVRMISKQKSHSNHELARYQLSHLQGNALLMGLLSRKGAYWNFTALGTPAEGNTVMHVIKDPSVAAILQRSKTSNPRAKKISISVIKGRNLAAKDKAGVFSRKKGTSDPFVQVNMGNTDNNVIYKHGMLKVKRDLEHVCTKNYEGTHHSKHLFTHIRAFYLFTCILSHSFFTSI